ncbi:aldehyde dehydrogenase family protein [Terracoccus luteus]|uniref:Succinate-semialdehyde dehydrogenase/glutarate-semialdehyde dehydrogenase n=1 Tax=Terracoccus luteus TaxID=53356 RepID=A0A839PUD5_9MICO|nr:aldehyde dehydrogenase family protein [Terracoccus luteus]MBB2986643.1 succinate-semialdehyde dehydrogenase/glutarate-semialdehyde dehydrogenase [Terracoccus luteus]MCP2171768.1 succinate-semialdehyde dehydrogenase/glutarate-semialdehyde dehydrogenase [Terracoccus luteus]
MSETSTVVVTTDPTTGRELARYDAMNDASIDHVLDEVAVAARAWGRTPLTERRAALDSVADRLLAERESVAALITAEMGKPLREARAEVDKSVTTARWYARHADSLLTPTPVDVGPDATAWVTHEPIGPVLAVMPWNFPLWQVMRFALPAILAGNGILLKHSPDVTGSALGFEALLERAGLPRHVFRILVVSERDVARVTDAVVADDRVAGVTLTGSNRAGASVGAAAGRAAKPSVLELGGSDAFVVLADADAERAAEVAVRARFTNAGQSCVCAKRFVVAAEVAEHFTEAFVARVRALRVGDPTDDHTDLGPLARPDLRDVLQRQVDASVAAGAELLVGGHPIDGPGNFYAPTVLAATSPGMAVFDEETFGPVAAVAVARDDAHAAELAAATTFGLGLSVWSGSRERALDLAREVTTGAVFVNAMVASDPRLPFGGTRRSGHGRELAAPGLHAFMNQRTFWAVP